MQIPQAKAYANICNLLIAGAILTLVLMLLGAVHSADGKAEGAQSIFTVQLASHALGLCFSECRSTVFSTAV